MQTNETARERASVRRVTSNNDKALLRMKRASDRGTGCYLTPEMIDALSCTVLAEWWGDAAYAHQQNAAESK
jgi:hypothetical protein